MNGFDTREQAVVAAQTIGGSVITAFDGTYLARGNERASDRGPYYQGADFAGYAKDLGYDFAVLLNGEDAANAGI